MERQERVGERWNGKRELESGSNRCRSEWSESEEHTQREGNGWLYREQ